MSKLTKVGLFVGLCIAGAAMGWGFRARSAKSS